MRSTKGISPFISSIILVVITLAIGFIISGTLRGVANQQADEIQEQSNPACQFSAITADKPTWDNRTVPPTLRMVITSTGTRDLKINGITVLYNVNESYASVKGSFVPKTVDAGDAITIAVTSDTDGQNISHNIDTVRVVTECPTQNILIDDSEINFIK